MRLEKVYGFPLMNQLNKEDLQRLIPHMNEHQFDNGSVILCQGDASEIFHIVLSGKVNVSVENETKVRLVTLGRGHFFGEMSCLTGDTVSATVEAEGTVETISMTRDGLLIMMENSFEFRKHMIEAMVERIQKSNEQVMTEHTRSLIMMKQLESEDHSRYGNLVGQSTQMKKLRDDLEWLSHEAGHVCVFGERGVGKGHFAAALHYRSPKRNNHPLLTVDGLDFDIDRWRMTVKAASGGTVVVKHANNLTKGQLNEVLNTNLDTRIILSANQLPRLPFEQMHKVEIAPLREHIDDIPHLTKYFLSKAGAINPEEAISQEALRMLNLFPFLSGNVAELKQVIRDAFILSGGKIIRSNHLRFGRRRTPGIRPTIGLALGSGTVRGAAHVGVLKVLEEEGIPVDMIAGTSVGAFIGALYAGGQPIQAFERVLPTVRWNQLVKFAFSSSALTDNKPMARFVEKYIGKKHFEDLAIPFAAVASDVNTGEAHILRTGLVSKAICASTAIPGLIRPVKYQDKTLVDGAVVHPVPAAIVKSMGADIVIAIDVSIPSFAKGPPKNFVGSILNTIDILSTKIVEEELQIADVVLRPQLGVSQYNFRNSKAFIQVGELVTREAIDTITEQIAHTF